VRGGGKKGKTRLAGKAEYIPDKFQIASPYPIIPEVKRRQASEKEEGKKKGRQGRKQGYARKPAAAGAKAALAREKKRKPLRQGKKRGKKKKKKSHGGQGPRRSNAFERSIVEAHAPTRKRGGGVPFRGYCAIIEPHTGFNCTPEMTIPHLASSRRGGKKGGKKKKIGRIVDGSLLRKPHVLPVFLSKGRRKKKKKNLESGPSNQYFSRRSPRLRQKKGGEKKKKRERAKLGSMPGLERDQEPASGETTMNPTPQQSSQSPHWKEKKKKKPVSVPLPLPLPATTLKISTKVEREGKKKTSCARCFRQEVTNLIFF